jgi:hypothetical protein
MGGSYKEASKIVLLASIFAVYFGIFIACFTKGGGLGNIVSNLILRNMGFYCIAWAAALICLVLYLYGKIDINMSFWVSQISH